MLCRRRGLGFRVRQGSGCMAQGSGSAGSRVYCQRSASVEQNATHPHTLTPFPDPIPSYPHTLPRPHTLVPSHPSQPHTLVPSHPSQSPYPRTLTPFPVPIPSYPHTHICTHTFSEAVEGLIEKGGQQLVIAQKAVGQLDSWGLGLGPPSP